MKRTTAPHRPAAAILVALALAVLAVLPAHALAQGTDATPERGGTLIVAMFDTVAHLNPAITTGGSVHAVADSVFDGLVRLDAAQDGDDVSGHGAASCRVS